MSNCLLIAPSVVGSRFDRHAHAVPAGIFPDSLQQSMNSSLAESDLVWSFGALFTAVHMSCSGRHIPRVPTGANGVRENASIEIAASLAGAMLRLDGLDTLDRPWVTAIHQRFLRLVGNIYSDARYHNIRLLSWRLRMLSSVSVCHGTRTRGQG